MFHLRSFNMFGLLKVQTLLPLPAPLPAPRILIGSSHEQVTQVTVRMRKAKKNIIMRRRNCRLPTE
jgi:hypothetical protein